MKDTIGSLNSLGSDAVRGSQQTVKAEVTSVGEKAKKGKDFDKKCDAVEIIDIKDETSPRKFTSVEVEDTTTVVGDQNSDDIKVVNVGRRSDLKVRRLVFGWRIYCVRSPF